MRAALRSDGPPRYERAARGSIADSYEPQVRALLVEWPRMPGPVIAARIGWPYSEGPLKKLLARVRPEYVGIDPVDRVVYEPGEIVAAAMIDRLVHHGKVLTLTGDSYRTRARRELLAEQTAATRTDDHPRGQASRSRTGSIFGIR